MSEINDIQKPSRKFLLNIIYFILSIIIVVTIWPHHAGDSWLKILGALILVSSSYLILYLFLSHFRSEVLHVTRKTLFIILMILSFILLTRVVTRYLDQNMLFLIPFVIIPVVIRTFYDARLAFLFSLLQLCLQDLWFLNPLHSYL